MATKVFAYDTTLRDGEQSEGITLSLEDKLRIVACLDDFGVDYIEGVTPPRILKISPSLKKLPKWISSMPVLLRLDLPVKKV